MIAPRAFVIDEEAHSATANAVKLAGSKLFLLNFVAVSCADKATFQGNLRQVKSAKNLLLYCRSHFRNTAIISQRITFVNSIL